MNDPRASASAANPKPCPLLAVSEPGDPRLPALGEQGRNVPMYRTSVDTVPAGRFRGKLVGSMRPFTPANAIRAIEITSRYPRVHGAPVHLGRPDLIGIEDLGRPWAGDPTEVRADE